MKKSIPGFIVLSALAVFFVGMTIQKVSVYGWNTLQDTPNLILISLFLLLAIICLKPPKFLREE